MRLTDARAAVEGKDYRVLTSYTNKNLNADNGQHFDGVTDDGLVLFRDGARADQLFPRYALMDPETGVKDWLPPVDIGQESLQAIELSSDRLVLMSLGSSAVQIFDRQTREWSTMRWSGLPPTARDSSTGALGPDGRLYLPLRAADGPSSTKGWPSRWGGQPDESDADGESSDLWSVSLTDSTDVRDEHLRVGSIGFADDSLVWSDSRNGAAGQLHVRDLASGAETSFDPQLGERCNLLGFDVAAERIMLSQYCGTYDGGVRDDRVQVMTTDGEQVLTIQDSGVEGGQLSTDGDFVTLASSGLATGGTYVYDIEDGRFIRLSDARASWEVPGAPAPGDLVLWNTPAGPGVGPFGHSGATTWLGELL